jgi:hypothetical protein
LSEHPVAAPHFEMVDAQVIGAPGSMFSARNILRGPLNQAIDNSVRVVCFTVDFKLAIGRSTARQDGVNVFDLLARVELIDHIVDEFELLEGREKGCG